MSLAVNHLKHDKKVTDSDSDSDSDSFIWSLQTQETSAKTKSGRCRRGHLEKNKVYSIHVCTNNSNY